MKTIHYDKNMQPHLDTVKRYYIYNEKIKGNELSDKIFDTLLQRRHFTNLFLSQSPSPIVSIRQSTARNRKSRTHHFHRHALKTVQTHIISIRSTISDGFAYQQYPQYSNLSVTLLVQNSFFFLIPAFRKKYLLRTDQFSGSHH